MIQKDKKEHKGQKKVSLTIIIIPQNSLCHFNSLEKVIKSKEKNKVPRPKNQLKCYIYFKKSLIKAIKKIIYPSCFREKYTTICNQIEENYEN